MNPWWHEQCPERGPALSHTQNGTLHCIHCGKYPRAEASPAVLPPLDVQARLRQLGMMEDQTLQPRTEQDTGMEDIAPDYDENAPREPKMTEHWEDGHLPTGPAWEHGRSWNGDGGLNPRDIPRLEAVAHRERRNGYQ